MKDIERPFGAFNSELQRFTYTIPEGYTAEIKDGKVIVKKEKDKNEREKLKGVMSTEQDMIRHYNQAKTNTKTTSIYRYEEPIILSRTIQLDFEKLYNYIQLKNPDFDKYDIVNYFGDNITFCLKNCCCINITSNDVEDIIWNDFGDWVEKFK